MNKERRNRIEELRDNLQQCQEELGSLASEERDYADNMPENLQQSERGEQAEAAASALEEAETELENLIATLGTAME